MSAGVARLLPFITASVVLHAVVFVAAGPESPRFNTAPADKGHEVSVRLEAAAPAGAAADSGETSIETPEAVKAEPPSRERPLEPKQSRIAQLEPVSEPTTEIESADSHDDRAEPVEESATGVNEPQPAEQIAEVDETATGNATTNSKAQRVEAREAIVAELAKHFRYPRLAQQRGWEGTVVLTVRILSDGRLDEIRVKRSSGRSLLDRSARQALAGIERLPQFADRIGEDGLALEIPVTYRLESA